MHTEVQPLHNIFTELYFVYIKSILSDLDTCMYRRAKIIQLELISHFAKRLETIFTFGLLEAIHFCRLVAFLSATDNTDITRALKHSKSNS